MDHSGISSARLITDIQILFQHTDPELISCKLSCDCTADNTAANDKHIKSSHNFSPFWIFYLVAFIFYNGQVEIHPTYFIFESYHRSQSFTRTFLDLPDIFSLLFRSIPKGIGTQEFLIPLSFYKKSLRKFVLQILEDFSCSNQPGRRRTVIAYSLLCSSSYRLVLYRR